MDEKTIPTERLRFVRRDGRLLLQQFHHYVNKYGGKWIDIPVVEPMDE
jgi:hypothetical protein